MGVDLGELVEPEEISFAAMNDTTIAVDALNTLYQFLSIIRQPDGTPLKDSQGRVTSHLSGLFYRTVKLTEHNITPVYVFDGEVPDLKAKESAERRKQREQARKEWKELKAAGKDEEARTKAAQSSKMTDQMLDSARRLLDAMGVARVQAPSEGEAQAAAMNAAGQVWAAASQDWDLLLFGADRMVRNLTTTGRRKVQGKDAYKEVVPEQVDAATAFTELGIDREKLIWLGILAGTDYNPGGVHGIGPKTAMGLVKEYDTFDALLEDEKVDWEHDADPRTVRDFFMDPPVTADADITPGEPDADGVRELLVEEHGFSEDRVGSKLDDYVAARQQRQTGLGSYAG